MTACHPLGVMFSAGEEYCPQALFTSPSNRPKRSSTAWTWALTCFSLRISHAWANTCLPVALIDAQVSSRCAIEREQIATLAPSEESSRAMARPIPVPPPVMRNTCPSNNSGRKMLVTAIKSLPLSKKDTLSLLDLDLQAQHG